MADFTNIPDCLVFKFEEYDTEKNELDTILYVLYDKKRHRYIVRGQRKGTLNIQCCTYSFECEYDNDLADFIQYVFCSHNKVNEILYNYDNLPDNSNEITFEFLQEYDNRDYEISGYNDKKLKRGRLLRNLRILRKIFNYY